MKWDTIVKSISGAIGAAVGFMYGAAGEIDANYAYEQLGKVIRDGRLNVPKSRKITAVKDLFSWELPDEMARLKAKGYMVTVE